MDPPTEGASTKFADRPLEKFELIWRDHYAFLKNHGYTLRPRYRPDWVRSWPDKPLAAYDAEDGVTNDRGKVMDATRPDGSFVMLKQINATYVHDEITIGRLLSSEPLFADKRNHCVPILDVIEPMKGSSWKFIVMPLLYRTELAPFKTIGEAVDFFRQIFEGLNFMHDNSIIHGDCKYDNIMADALGLYDSAPHPFRPAMRRDFSGRTSNPTPRTKRPIKYYLIDYDLAKVYKHEDAPYLRDPPWGGDKTVPEHLIPGHPPCDPFPVDVYCIGNAIREHFFGGLPHRPARRGFEFMQGLISDMVQDDPKKRPSMSEVVTRFDQIVEGLNSWKLRSPVVTVDKKLGIFRSAFHWTKQSYYTVLRLPPIPRYQPKARARQISNTI